MSDLGTDLKCRALDEGFDLVGIASAGEAQGAESLRRWLHAGMHGEMAYMATTAEIRSDLGRLLPNCRSVIAVALSYHTSRPDSRSSDDPNTVWISRYAWGRDYHRILKKKLIRLGRWLAEQRPGAGWRACVDTAPALEREWAARAGLGWIGKNTMLINRRLGSELFLGLLLTDIDLTPDGPTPEHCGRCTACLDACPTEAFVEPRRLDARRCIAYLTVEHRGAIHEEFQRPLGNMAAGCDICNEVCPFTRKAPADLNPEFQPAPHRFQPALADLEALDDSGWRSWRQGSPLNRIPHEALKRTLTVIRKNAEKKTGGRVKEGL
ncbi:MAG: tRNA epoxyqueuosine(34) reductase QueG [Acidobacteria bacterium]|nr:MAG: tRNA epoxyqueuosine(34) reductase QueG [Acidobacteriota bacterium]